jgi:hypothetical protein
VAYSGLKYPEATWCSGNRTANFDGVKTNKDGKKRFNGLECVFRTKVYHPSGANCTGVPGGNWFRRDHGLDI